MMLEIIATSLADAIARRTKWCRSIGALRGFV